MSMVAGSIGIHTASCSPVEAPSTSAQVIRPSVYPWQARLVPASPESAHPSLQSRRRCQCRHLPSPSQPRSKAPGMEARGNGEGGGGKRATFPPGCPQTSARNGVDTRGSKATAHPGSLRRWDSLVVEIGVAGGFAMVGCGTPAGAGSKISTRPGLTGG